jgi:Spy/CpxP family protein refolding chaperone
MAAGAAALLVGALMPAAMQASAPSAAVHAASDQAAGRATQGDRKNRPGQISATAEWEWWNDPDIRRELRLSDETAANLQAIFQRRVSEIQPLVNSLNHESDRLNQMTNARVADEVTYGLQVARVEWLASRFRETRTIMLYRMFRELQPEQYRKLQQIIEQRMAQRRARGAGPGR